MSLSPKKHSNEFSAQVQSSKVIIWVRKSELVKLSKFVFCPLSANQQHRDCYSANQQCKNWSGISCLARGWNQGAPELCRRWRRGAKRGLSRPHGSLLAVAGMPRCRSKDHAVGLDIRPKTTVRSNHTSSLPTSSSFNRWRSITNI
jgi:hypothetical protein